MCPSCYSTLLWSLQESWSPLDLLESIKFHQKIQLPHVLEISVNCFCNPNLLSKWKDVPLSARGQVLNKSKVTCHFLCQKCSQDWANLKFCPHWHSSKLLQTNLDFTAMWTATWLGTLPKAESWLWSLLETHVLRWRACLHFKHNIWRPLICLWASMVQTSFIGIVTLFLTPCRSCLPSKEPVAPWLSHECGWYTLSLHSSPMLTDDLHHCRPKATGLVIGRDYCNFCGNHMLEVPVNICIECGVFVCQQLQKLVTGCIGKGYLQPNTPFHCLLCNQKYWKRASANTTKSREWQGGLLVGASVSLLVIS